MNKPNFDLTFLGKFIYYMLQTPELPGALPPWPHYQGFALDPLGAFCGPQTPRPIFLHPPPSNSWLRPCDLLTCYQQTNQKISCKCFGALAKRMLLSVLYRLRYDTHIFIG